MKSKAKIYGILSTAFLACSFLCMFLMTVLDDPDLAENKNTVGQNVSVFLMFLFIILSIAFLVTFLLVYRADKQRESREFELEKIKIQNEYELKRKNAIQYCPHCGKELSKNNTSTDSSQNSSRN